MDRPPSQLENMRPSALPKPPSRLPASSTNRSLLETTESHLNSRTARDDGERGGGGGGGGGGRSMAPPAFKHKITGRTSDQQQQHQQQPEVDYQARAELSDVYGSATNTRFTVPEPPTKRKTLAERAAEPINPPRSHLAQPSRSGVSRTDSSSATVGSRGYGNFSSYRNTSNVSTASTNSVSSTRQPSRQQSARHVGSRPPSAASNRAIAEEEQPDVGVSGKRKGTTPLLSFNHFITLRKTRTQGDLHQQSQVKSTRSQHHAQKNSSQERSLVIAGPAEEEPPPHALTSSPEKTASSQSDVRNVSLNTAFSNLHITPQETRKHSGQATVPKHRPSLERIREEVSPSKIPKFSCTPSLRHTQSLQVVPHIPTLSPLKHKVSMAAPLRTPTAITRRKDELPVFLTKEKLTPLPAWDTKGRLEDMEHMYYHLKNQFSSAADSKQAIEESLAFYKSQVQELKDLNKELKTANQELTTSNRDYNSDLERARSDLHTKETDLRSARRDHERDVEDVERRHEKHVSDLLAKQEKEVQRLLRENEKESFNWETKLEDAKDDWKEAKQKELDELRDKHRQELEETQAEHDSKVAGLQCQLDELKRSGEGRAEESASQVQGLRDSIASLESQLEAANATISSLRSQITSVENRAALLDQEKTALVSKAHFLEGNQEAQSLEFTNLSKQLQEAIDEREHTLVTLRQEEMLRRKLNATILELRGNIRVFVRIRPRLQSVDGEADPARVEYPDRDTLDGGKEMVVHAPTTFSATGKERNEKHPYAFDRVFGPDSTNHQVFEECRDLVQSVVDGYNVSILSYGQTGSGKTFGMSGENGIIPSSISLLLSEMLRLKSKGWEYKVEANFVEVYNENLNDLLGDAKTWDTESDPSNRGKKQDRHEIHHDAITGKTTVTNLSSVNLWPPPTTTDASPDPDTLATQSQDPSSRSAPPSDHSSEQAKIYTSYAVADLLDTASRNRRVAATKANERSSRSHSVFILTLKGHCATTNESSEGILNLVDLAGSERLKQSGAAGDRMKETQAINKSLSSLGDVVASLGSKREGAEHVPYRNSKLTYLLQSSLGGAPVSANGKSSRTLMLLHLSPLMAHWQESRSSLLFGSKVNGTVTGKKK